MEFVLKLEKPFIFSSHMLRNKNKKIKRTWDTDREPGTITQMPPSASQSLLFYSFFSTDPLFPSTALFFSFYACVAFILIEAHSLYVVIAEH